MRKAAYGELLEANQSMSTASFSIGLSMAHSAPPYSSDSCQIVTSLSLKCQEEVRVSPS